MNVSIREIRCLGLWLGIHVVKRMLRRKRTLKENFHLNAHSIMRITERVFDTLLSPWQLRERQPDKLEQPHQNLVALRKKIWNEGLPWFCLADLKPLLFRFASSFITWAFDCTFFVSCSLQLESLIAMAVLVCWKLLNIIDDLWPEYAAFDTGIFHSAV